MGGLDAFEVSGGRVDDGCASRGCPKSGGRSGEIGGGGGEDWIAESKAEKGSMLAMDVSGWMMLDVETDASESSESPLSIQSGLQGNIDGLFI